MSIIDHPVNRLPPDLQKWVDPIEYGGVVWKRKALMTLTGLRMAEIREEVKSNYSINIMIEADAIYDILDRIRWLEQTVNELVKKQTDKDERNPE